MLIAAKEQRFALALRHRDGDQLVGKTPRLLRRRRTQLATQRKRILIRPRNGEIVRHVFRRFRHRIHAVQRFHLRVNEAPADGGIFHPHRAAKGAFGLAHHKWRPRHAFYATGDHQLSFAAFNRARCDADRIKAGTAQAVNGTARYAFRQSGQQQRHTRDVAVIFPRLVGAAVNHIINTRRIESRVAFQQRFQRQRRQIVGAQGGQGTAKAAERRAHRITDKCLIHHRFLTRFPPVVQKSAPPE